MTPRLRRLAADATRLAADFGGHRSIRVTPVGVEPAEQYKIEYWVRGVHLPAGSAQPGYAEYFTLRLVLPTEYPRVKPLFLCDSPVFHPNFGTRVGDEVCIADYWTPSQSLSDLVIKIGEMLQYQDYNTKSPLNALAARWADENSSLLPVGSHAIAVVPAAGDDGVAARPATTAARVTFAPPAPPTPVAAPQPDSEVVT